MKMSTHQEIDNPNESIPDRWARISARQKPRTKDEAKDNVLDAYYYASDKNKGKIFLLKQNKFISLENLDDKLDEYRERLNSRGFKDSFAFQYDFQVMTLIKEHRQTAENLKRDYADTYNRIMNRLGEDALKLLLFNPKEAWKLGSKNILEDYASLFESCKKLPSTTMPPGESPFFIYARSLLPEPILAEEPRNMPEQDYLDKLMLESPEFQKEISEATKALRKLWRGIIPVDDARKTPIPYQSPKPTAYLPNINIDRVISTLAKADEKRKAYVAPAKPAYDEKPAPNNDVSQTPKAIGRSSAASDDFESEDLDPEDLESTVFKASQASDSLTNHDKTKCKRDHVPDSDIIRCLEPADKYSNCTQAYHRFKTWQCCKPGD